MALVTAVAPALPSPAAAGTKATTDPPALPVVSIEPERPQAGDSLTITYDTGAPGAALALADGIYLTIGIGCTDHASRRIVALMQPKHGSMVAYTMTVPADAALLNFIFTTLRDSDTKNHAQVMVRRPDGQPVRTAWEHSMLAGLLPRDYLDRFEHEIALYPDNVAAYRNKWFVAGAFDRDTVRATVAKDMRRLQRRVRGDSLEGLYALSCGYAGLDQEGEALGILRRMAAVHPEAPLTAAAIRNYLYQAYAQHWPKADRDEAAALARQIDIRYPDAQAARDNLGGSAYDVTFPLEALETTANHWLEQMPDDPLPAYYLATGYEKRGLKMQEAFALAGRAVDGMLRGSLRPYEDPSGSLTRYYLPGACLLSGRIAFALDRPAVALGYAKTAVAVSVETTPEAYLLEGKVWQSLGDDAAAEAARFEAYRLGSKEGETALRDSYARTHGDASGFDTWLHEKSRPASGTASGIKPAPPFSGVSITGDRFDSATLRGKVVVLNFWGPGCGPCKAEIPDLNRLAGKFQGRGVVFLAPAGDDADGLALFLREHPFSYQVIPAANTIFASFDISSLPVHVVIGKEGEIVARLSGAGDDREEQLARLIDQALAR